MNVVRRWLLGSLLLLIAYPALCKESPLEETSSERVLRSHVGFLNEMSERRRVNTFFPNEQSAFYGLPIRYVNSYRGNLTFVRRDLVAVGRIPAVLARVYDSSLKTSGAFGPGWHLTLAETIVQGSDGSLTYVDDSASELSFVRGSDGYVARYPGPTDITSIETRGDEMRVVLRSGWTKQFRRMNDRFVLTTVRNPHGSSLTIRYLDGRLSRIDGQNGRFISVAWDASGRISRITDDQRREVSYAYDRQGRLETVTDLGRNQWRHKYDRLGRLERVTDPRNIVTAEAIYDVEGRARTVRMMGATYEYQYEGEETSVVDDTKRITRVAHNRFGLATSLTNPIGLVSEVQLDEQNRVSVLLQRGAARARFAYGAGGRIDRLTRIEDTGAVDLAYEYDAEGRPKQITGTDGSSVMFAYNSFGDLQGKRDGDETVAYDHTPQGDLRSVTRGGETTTYAHNADGQIETITSPRGITRLNYYPVGKLKSIQFPDGSVSEYRYNALGFREAAKRSDSAEIKYQYDVAGNLVLSDGHSASGKLAAHDHNHAIEINASNQAEVIRFPGRNTLRVAYDANGNPETVTTSDDPKAPALRYIYDAANRVVAVQDGDAVVGSHVYKDDEPDLRVQLDDRTMRVGADSVRQSGTIGDIESIVYARPYGSHLGVVRFDESTRTFGLPSEFGIAAPDAVVSNSLTRRRFANVDDHAGGKARDRFDLPSNIIFLPPEYATINCAPGCVFGGITVKANGAWPTLSVVDGTNVTLRASQISPSGCTRLTCSWTKNGLPIGSGLNTLVHKFEIPGSYQVAGVCECVPCDMFATNYVTVNVTLCPTPPGVSLQTLTAATVPANRTRTKLGVGEQVTVSLSPAPSCPVTWSKSGNNGTLSVVNNSTAIFTAQDRFGAAGVLASFSGTTRSKAFNVVEPTAEIAVKTSELTFPAGTQGAVMELLITVQPTDVSFQNIQFREVSGPVSNLQGYFIGRPPGSHNANPALPLNNLNQWGDITGFFGNPPPWFPGSFQYDIPVRWQVASGSSGESSGVANRLHVSTITNAAGTSITTKLGKSATRSPMD